MLRVLAKEFGWSHQDMMMMKKRTLFRYYGYILIDNIKRAEKQEADERAERFKEGRDNAQWKKL
jgi:hypothetical protein